MFFSLSWFYLASSLLLQKHKHIQLAGELCHFALREENKRVCGYQQHLSPRSTDSGSSARSLRLHGCYYFKTTTVYKIAAISSRTQQSQPVVSAPAGSPSPHRSLPALVPSLSPNQDFPFLMYFSWFSLNPSHIKKHPLTKLCDNASNSFQPSPHTMHAQQGLDQDFGCEVPEYLEMK